MRHFLKLELDIMTVTYVSNLKVLSHEQIKRGGGVTSDRTDTTAAVTQKTQTQVGTKFCVLFKQHLWELQTNI